MIELVIKISEEEYERFKKNQKKEYSELMLDINIIANGISLPKGHGKLVDLDQMCEDYWDGGYMEINSENLKNIKTIVEADT